MSAETAERLRRELSWLAAEVATCLVAECDDDERERLQEHFERELNGEMHAAFGGPPRVRPFLAVVRPGAIVAPVVDLASRREPVGA